MIAQGSFSPHEWQQIADSVFIVGMAVMFADNGSGTGKELTAFMTEVMAAENDPSGNWLTRAVVADLTAAGFKTSFATGRRVTKHFGQGKQMSPEAFDILCEVSRLIDSKAPREAAGFKTWLIRIGEGIAAASREGGFLGLGAVQVSEAERAALTDISRALGLTATGGEAHARGDGR